MDAMVDVKTDTNITEGLATSDRVNQSIHLRVRNGRTLYDKVNTCKQKSKDVLKRKIDSIKKHLEIHPRDGSMTKRLATLSSQL